MSRRGLTGREQVQLLYALLLVLLFLAYLVILGAAAYGTLAELVRESNATETPVAAAVGQVEATETAGTGGTVGGGGTTRRNEAAPPETAPERFSWRWFRQQAGDLWGGLRTVAAIAWAVLATVGGWLANAWDWLTNQVGLRLAQAIVIGAVLVSLVAPRIRRLAEQVPEAATSYAAAIYYLDLGERRDVVIGQLWDVLEHVARKRNPAYGSIHIVGYSFGAVVAFDALFPFANKPGKRFEMVTSLTTIGFPFDFVRTYWPWYFEGRAASPLLGVIRTPDHRCVKLDGAEPSPNPEEAASVETRPSAPGAPEPERSSRVGIRWYNVYSPLDVLSSNFRDNTADVGDAEVGVPIFGSDKQFCPENVAYVTTPRGRTLTRWDVAKFVGLRSHGSYWPPHDEPGTSAFDEVIPLALGTDERTRWILD